MDKYEFAWMLLSPPASAAIGFMAYALPVTVLNWLVEVVYLTSGRSVAAPGLRGYARRWWCLYMLVWGRSRRAAVRRISKVLIVILAAIVLAVAISLIGGSVLLIPSMVARAATGRHRVGGVPPVIYLGVVFGMWSLLRGLGYTAAPTRRRRWSSLPRLRIPADSVSRPRRMDIARDVYRYRTFQVAVDAGVAMGLLALLAGTGTTADSTSSTFDDDPWQYVWFAGGLLTFAIWRGLRWIVDALSPRARVAVAIANFLDGIPKNTPRSRRRNRSRAGQRRYVGIPAPHGRQYRVLVDVADCIGRLGRRVEAAHSGHPLATLLTASSRRLRFHLLSVDSLVNVRPPAVVQTLEATLIVLAGPWNCAAYRRIADSLEAFDSDGAPRKEHPVSVPSRWMGLVVRGGSFLEAHARLLTALWALFTTAAVVFLLTTGRLHLANIQLQK